MNSKWMLTICAVALMGMAQSAYGQDCGSGCGGCGTGNNTFSYTNFRCQGYTQARAEALWAGYCGENCWGNSSEDDCGCQFGGRLRGLLSRGCNECGSRRGFGFGRGCNECNDGCGFSLRGGGFFKHGCGSGCAQNLFCGLKGLSLPSFNFGCNTGCKPACDAKPACGVRCFAWPGQNCQADNQCGCGAGGLQLLSRIGSCKPKCHNPCGLLSNLRGMFQRSGYGCCDSGCNQAGHEHEGHDHAHDHKDGDHGHKHDGEGAKIEPKAAGGN